MSTAPARTEPAQICAPAPADRPLDDRLAEVIRRYQFGLILPLWQDLPEYKRKQWRGQVPAILTMLESVGVKVEIEP